MKIEKSIPVPRQWAMGLTTAMSRLEVGDSLHFDGPLSSPHVIADRLGITVVCRTEKNGCRVWRVAGETARALAQLPRRGSMNAAIKRIAREILDLETLKTRKMDSLDFHELAVWQIRKALEAAYNAGRESLNQ
jgi:hypothetical protein